MCSVQSDWFVWMKVICSVESDMVRVNEGNVFSSIWLVCVNEGNVFCLIWLVQVNKDNERVQFNLIGLCEWR